MRWGKRCWTALPTLSEETGMALGGQVGQNGCAEQCVGQNGTLQQRAPNVQCVTGCHSGRLAAARMSFSLWTMDCRGIRGEWNRVVTTRRCATHAVFGPKNRAFRALQANGLPANSADQGAKLRVGQARVLLFKFKAVELRFSWEVDRVHHSVGWRCGSDVRL